MATTPMTAGDRAPPPATSACAVGRSRPATPRLEHCGLRGDGRLTLAWLALLLAAAIKFALGWFVW
jgi:hypothetical protein